MVASSPTPLCPTGHLPLKGGDWQLWRCRPSSEVGDLRNQWRQQISPLEGEMSGRTEGGALAPYLS
ncbi:MAG: lytic murein transglycosylase [Mesorhizobium sp.]|nr:MAG: lytic murein transglycosylase [Mesorhizobium sp.]RWC64112.1 MAG: lytic murein transglycosylase [Mesorhizobium sp.]